MSNTRQKAYLSGECPGRYPDHPRGCQSVGRTKGEECRTADRTLFCRANAQDGIRNTRENVDLSTERKAKNAEHQTKHSFVGRMPRTVSGIPERMPICRLNERRRMPNTRQKAHLSGECPGRYHACSPFVQTAPNNPKQQQAPEATYAVASGALLCMKHLRR